MRTAARPSRRRPRRRAAPREAGYNMVILVVAVTILNVMVAMALPQWSHLMRRDREEELRSRGLQYAEAVRIFEMRHGRLPERLDLLLKVEPRSIRRLWKDPMTDDGKWGLLFRGVPPEVQEQADRGNPGLERIVVGPIIGVHSKSKEEALASFFGAKSYDQWRFTVDLLRQGKVFRPDSPSPRLSLRTLGRPFRPGLELPPIIGPEDVGGGQTLAGGNAGQPGQPIRPGRPGRPLQPTGRVPGFPDRGQNDPPDFPDRGQNDPPGDPNGRPGGGLPGFPGFPGGTPPGGTPPGGSPGFDPTVPQNGSAPLFMPPPA